MKRASKIHVVPADTPITLLAGGRKKIFALVERRDRSIKKLRTSLRQTQAEVITLSGELDKALHLYDAARVIIRRHQDADAKALRHYELDAMDRAERRDKALGEALKNEIEQRVASLEVGMARADLRHEAETIADLLVYWPCSPTVTGIVAAATNRDGKRPNAADPLAESSEDGEPA